MTGPSSRSAVPADDGWGSATTTRSGTGRSSSRSGTSRSGSQRRTPDRTADRRESAPGDLDWSGRDGTPGRSGRSTANGRSTDRQTDRTERDNGREPSRSGSRSGRVRAAREFDEVRAAIERPHERGLPGWAALLVMLAIAVLGGIIDTVDVFNLQGGFNVGIVVASIVAVLIVKRSHMFPVVIAPPIVYTLGAGFQYYVKSRSGNAGKAKLDAAANYLVYGFPAIATACAAVLIIAGIRMIIRK